MNLVLLKHFSFDDESALISWATRNGHSASVLYPPELTIYPEPDTFDMLIILGGPMSVYEEAQYPWLKPEKQFVKRAMEQHKKVLGICLGAQMIAELAGGRVYRHAHKEIGWHRVERTGQSHGLFPLPDTFTSFQWHGDVFELPEGAVHLARSAACPHQAFALGPHILGVQFHLETSPACIESMLKHWSAELIEGPYIQSAADIRSGLSRSEASAGLLHRILDRLGAIQSRQSFTSRIVPS
ncbi:type 1 glutamine amidotransferase [Paenibacillus filicis]|uniref:Type 1 glutamine amidotransferase n=1 Tax=Paenibacillus filicis TaxID=669464 RepID=A0ABU9DKT5_9BACL